MAVILTVSSAIARRARFRALAIPLPIEVFASGQRVASRKVTLAKPVALGDIEIEDNGDAAPVRASDGHLVARVRDRGRTLRRWTAGTRRSFGYREAALAGDRFQLISVDGSLRRAIVDRGSDGRADYELWYRGDGAPLTIGASTGGRCG